MHLRINGQMREIPDGLTLSRLVKHLGLEPPAAVQVNGELIPRARLGDTFVREGDSVELIPLPAGG